MVDEVRVPTYEEIAKLPRWARVAFAIRCARRVQPVFKAMWPDAPDEHVAAIERAIQHAERLLVVGLDDAFAAPAADAYAVADAARAAGHAAHAYAAYAAANAVEAAHITDARLVFNAGLVIDEAAYAARAAANAAADARVHAAIRRDFEMLMVLSEREHWNDETRPSLESLPPLWLEGEEPNWKETARRARQSTGEQEAGDNQRLVLTAYVDEPVDDDTLVEGITELYRALNKYHILCGGSGLTIDGGGILVRVRAPEGVLV